MNKFPIRRPKRDPKDYSGPKPKPGQTAMLCPVDKKYTVFSFTLDDSLQCANCGYKISRSETV